MFYDETQAISSVGEEPSLVFQLIKEDHISIVEKVLSKRIIDINICDDLGNNLMMRLLKHGSYDIVLKNMSNPDWDINKQNNDGDTFGHILATINYVNVAPIINKLKKNKTFIPNIKNNKGETILDKSINNNYIYTTIKILEDSRFNNIDIVSFKNLYDTYIKSNHYGKYSKVTNLEIIVDNLENRQLLPRMEKLIEVIKENFEVIKDEFFKNKYGCLDKIIKDLLTESNA
ncbi:MAG: hypothetical protein PHQ64_04125 [Bacilli bacterium]|nr:hypothetical protein [Bacilli bacterium]